MQELLNQLNEMSEEELKSLILRAQIILEKKEEETARRMEQQALELERQKKAKELEEQISQLNRQLSELNSGEVCPSCGNSVAAGSVFCSVCGARMNGGPAAADTTMHQPAPQPAYAAQEPQPVPQPAYAAPEPQPAPQPAYTAPVRPVQQPVYAAAPAQPVQPPVSDLGLSVKRYNGEQKKWQLLPGETVVLKWDGASMLLPDPKTKDVYYLELTNQRLLISAEKASSASMRNVAFGMAGHLLTPEKGKPWLEVPLGAVKGFWKGKARKEFCFEADTVYSFVIGSADKLLDMLRTLLPHAAK